jgi:hypothetical protein
MPTIIAGVTVLEMAQGDGVLTPAQIEKAMIVGVKIKEALARSHKAGARIAIRAPGENWRAAENRTASTAPWLDGTDRLTSRRARRQDPLSHGYSGRDWWAV